MGLQQPGVVYGDEAAPGSEAALAVDVPGDGQMSIPRGVPKGPVRIFIDGAFDLMHFGHMNAFRQARALGDHLIVGVNSDESVAACKGLGPVLNDAERQAAVSACRFVDEIIPASPYIMTEEYIQELVASHGVDFFVHGDDPCIVDGRDVYEAAKLAGRYKSIPRTEGISTTEIVGRMLLMSKEHHEETPHELAGATISSRKGSESGLAVAGQSRFLVTSRLMQLFTADLPRQLAKGSRIVYVDGAWDMFHSGHISLLQKARALGDGLLVGVHSDAVVQQHRGANHPILCMHERVLGLLGCRYVDDVLFDAPWFVTQEMIATLGISVVVRGKVRDSPEAVEVEDPHAVPKSLGISVELDSDSGLTLNVIMQRLHHRREDMQARYRDKHRREQEWYKQKHALA